MYQISGIRNQVSESMLKNKVKKKKRESINTHNRKAKNYTPNENLSSIQGGGERELELPMALRVSALLTTLYGVYTLLHGICCHEHRIFFLVSVDKVHVGTLGTWELEAKVHTYIYTYM